MMRLLILIGVIAVAAAESRWCAGVLCPELSSCINGVCLCDVGYNLVYGRCKPSDICTGVACPENSYCRETNYFASCLCTDGYVCNAQSKCVCDPAKCKHNSTCIAGICECNKGYVRRAPYHPCTGCSWGPWTASDCDENRRIVRTRVKIEEPGGRQCGGPETSTKTCIANSEVAAKLIETISEVKTRRSSSVNKETQQSNKETKESNKETEESSEEECTTNEHYGQGGVTVSGRHCGEPTLKIIQNSTEEELPHRDILFMVDESGSVGEDKFKKEMQLVLTLISQFCGEISIAHDQTHVGVMTFDKVPHVHFLFNRYFSQPLVYQIASEIRYSEASEGATCLADALKLAHEMFTQRQRYGARIDADRMIILITDGCANCDDAEIEEIATDLEKDEISIITYVIADNDKCLDKMEALIDGSRCSQFFRTNWKNFDDVVDELGKKLCLTKWTAAGGSSCN